MNPVERFPDNRSPEIAHHLRGSGLRQLRRGLHLAQSMAGLRQMTSTNPSADRFNIGEAAARSGVSAKMVRHYESLGLLPTIVRTEAGYRLYGEREVHTLRFIRRGRGLGFSMSEIEELVKLWQNPRRTSSGLSGILCVRHSIATQEHLCRARPRSRWPSCQQFPRS